MVAGVFVYLCVCKCVCVCVCGCLCVCGCVCVCLYVHTHACVVLDSETSFCVEEVQHDQKCNMTRPHEPHELAAGMPIKVGNTLNLHSPSKCHTPPTTANAPALPTKRALVTHSPYIIFKYMFITCLMMSFAVQLVFDFFVLHPTF